MSSQIKPYNKAYAVVFALDTINGLQTARTLAKRSIPVIGIANDLHHPYCRTKVCEKIILADTQSEDLIKVLESLGPGFLQKAVLFPCNNVEMLLISRQRQRLHKWFHVILSDPAVDEMLMNKNKFYTFAQEQNFPIARTFMIKDRYDAEKATQELVFPCVIKPSNRTDEWDKNVPYKAYKVFTADEFFAVYDQFEKWSKDLIVQEWIEGPESNLYTCYCYFDHDSEPLVTFVTRKIRQWPPEMGEGCLGEECRNDIVLHETVKLFKLVCLRGLGYLEMKCDSRTGKYFIIEPNVGRPTSKSALAEAGGVELVYTMYCDALGMKLPANREQKYGNAKWVFLRRDFTSALYYWKKGELPLVDWWRSLKGAKIDAVFSWDDQAPFWFDLINSIRRYISPGERKKNNYRTPFPR